MRITAALLGLEPIGVRLAVRAGVDAAPTLVSSSSSVSSAEKSLRYDLPVPIID